MWYKQPGRSVFALEIAEAENSLALAHSGNLDIPKIEKAESLKAAQT